MSGYFLKISHSLIVHVCVFTHRLSRLSLFFDDSSNLLHFLGVYRNQICGIIGVEFETEICKNATWVQAAVVCYDLDELDKLLETNIKPYDVKMRLRAILAKIRDCDNYISEWTSLFYWKVI